MRRREFIGTGLVAAGSLAFGPGFWSRALAADTQTRLGPGPYGALKPADANGLMLPEGFTSRVVARANQPVPGTTYRWPVFPDGKACFAAPDGGWIVVANSEARVPEAGASAIRFDARGEIADAYRILGETNGNCSGGPTPWGTWLSCEEVEGGLVWECDPTKESQGTARPAMGAFNHEAAAVDPVGRRAYLTEDEPDGGFYRFTPRAYPDLSEGLLEVLVAGAAGAVGWAEVPDPAAITGATRTQVPAMKRFAGGEGIWWDSGIVYFSTKGENRVYAYDTVATTLSIVYDRAAFGDGAPISGLDNVIVSRSGDLFVCEDGGNMEMGLVTREREATSFFRLTGPPAEGSEIAGVTFNPAGDRLYFSSQRALGFGITYEIRGPFRTDRPTGAGGPAGVAAPRPAQAPGSAPDEPGADRPRLRITAPRSVKLSTLRARGLPVTVEAPRGSRLRIALRTDDLETVAGQRGSVERPKLVYLGRAERGPMERRRVTARVRIGPKAAARVRRRRRSIRARVIVLARTPSGRPLVATRLLRIRLSRR